MKFKNEIISIISGFFWACSGVFLATLTGEYVFGVEKTYLVFFAPIFLSGINDMFVTVNIIIYNIINKNIKEFKKLFKSKDFKFLIIASIFGGIIGQSSYVTAIFLSGPAYSIPISALTPMFGGFFAWIFLKQKINIRIIIGMIGCVIGAFIISYTKPEGSYPHFYLGIGLAFLSAISWGLEATLVTFVNGNDIKEEVALNIRSIVSFVGIFVVLIFATNFFEGMGMIFSKIDIPTTIFASSIFATLSYVLFYKGLLLNGVGKGMALNSTFSIWSVILSTIFLGTPITLNLVIGAVLVLISVGILSFGNK